MLQRQKIKEYNCCTTFRISHSDESGKQFLYANGDPARYQNLIVCSRVVRWRNGYSVGLAIDRSRVQILIGATLRNNLGSVVHAYVPLSPNSITWYRSTGGDALRLGRQPQAWRKVMAAYRRVDDLWSPAD